MRKILLLLIPAVVLTLLFLLIVLVVNRDSGKGALQATSLPPSQVFVNGKFVGKTPLCLCEANQLLDTGEYSVKLVPLQASLKPYEQKISIYQGVLTVVDRTFEGKISGSSGSVITLSPIDDKEKSELLIVSFPSNAEVILNSNPVGRTPLLLKEITVSDQEIKILKDGYREKVVKIRSIEGKRLEVTAYLGIRPDLAQEKVSPTSAPSAGRVVILDTPTGYLRVRQEDSVEAAQIATLNTGEEVELIQEKSEWFQIKLSDGRLGWVSSTYARKK
jgi:hypothetical protein